VVRLPTRKRRPAGTSTTASTALGTIGWASIVIGFAAEKIGAAGSPEMAQNVLVTTLTIFFLAQIARLTLAVITTPERRITLSLLLVAVASWGVGSAILNGSELPDLTKFPAPGEVFFLVSYVAIVGYLIGSTRRSIRRPLDSWLHVLVICGGAACLSSTLLLLPVDSAYRGSGLGLLLALLYPLIDLVLALLVIGQMMLRLRDGGFWSVSLLAGFLAWAYADAHFVTQVGLGTYHFSVLSDAAYGIGFALIVSSACRPAPKAARALPRRQGPAETLAAAAAAVVVLVLHPGHAIAPYLLVPAVLTLLGAGGRLVLALREANGAAEALALSRTDDLTRLPNRRALRSGLDVALARRHPLALLLLDLDGFKDINDTLGHAAGDNVLQLVAHRLRAALGPTTLVARLGGDEFAILFEDTDPITAAEIARALLTTVNEPLRIDGIEIVPAASIGITTVDDAELNATELMRRADVAMYQAKHSRSGVALYDAHLDDFSKAKLALAEELRRGIAEEQLELWYQPQVDAATQRLCGFEALVRWRHPTQGLLAPVAFLPAARRAGLMPSLSALTVRLAVAELARWRSMGLDVTVALNCAPPELLSGTLLPILFAAVSAAGLPRESLVIEVTEDSFLAEPERARQLLGELRDHGLQVSIDDYGTGFSSLAYLRDLPVDELKIDRTFVSAMTTDDRSRMIVASTVQMASALSVRTVAEGIEDAATAEDLVALGVDVLQGYHIARPMPADEVPGWYEQWTALHRDVHALAASGASRSLWPAPAPRPTRSLRAVAPLSDASTAD
jgi:diguanylate cyclase (GGDEF)-like protein